MTLVSRDPCERALINLATARTEYSPGQGDAAGVNHSFSIVTYQRGYLVQAANDRDLHDWLYAINPLLAGQIKSRTGLARPQEANGRPGGRGAE